MFAGMTHDQTGPDSPGSESPPVGPYLPVGAAGVNPWLVVATVLAGLWSVGVTVLTQSVGWLVDQMLLAGGVDLPALVWPAIGLGNAALVGLPALLLATLPRSAGIRAAGRVWLIGAAALGGLGLLRGIAMPHHEFYLAGLAGLTAGAALLLRRWRMRSGAAPAAEGTWIRRPPPLAGGGTAATLLAAAAGMALLLPWLWLGALGGVLETVLAGMAAAAVGWFAAETLDASFWAVHRAGGRRPGVRLIVLGGMVAGVALTLLAAGIGQPGAHLIAIVVLPPTAFAAAACWLIANRADTTASIGANAAAGAGAAAGANAAAGAGAAAGANAAAGAGSAAGWLVGLAAAGPLAFVDAEEISLLLALGRDLPFWAAVAAGATLVVALLLSTGYGVAFGRTRSGTPRRWAAALTAAVVAVGGAAVYLGAGQPGPHGERLFVVLREQADLGGVGGGSGPAGRDARAQEVYRRLVTTAERSQAALRRDLDRWGLRYTPYYLVNAIEVDAGPVVRAWLSRRVDVDRVLVSQELRPLPADLPTEHGDQPAPRAPGWNLTMIGADRVWSELGVDGSGIVVGGSDSGVDGSHPALAGGFRGGDDSWYDPWNDTRTPTDRIGHGTHTLGSAVGGADIGVAPGATWVGCVNLDRNLGNPARYLDCLQFMLAPFPAGGDPFTDGRPDRAPHVLTNSWGCPGIEGCDPAALRPATAALAAAGVLVVVAAGNTGPFCGSIDDPPAPYADVLTIGAVDRQREVTAFSSRGPTPDGIGKPDLVAPGADVLSAMPGGGYATVDGTSMATPHVAGVVALMWSANPNLIGDLDRTTDILRRTAGRAGTDGSDGCGDPADLTGAGLVNAHAAVEIARTAG